MWTKIMPYEGDKQIHHEEIKYFDTPKVLNYYQPLSQHQPDFNFSD